ncbi:kinase-like protein, partial [Suhomyces tanzawaensis NRRL Y-17324]
ASPVSSRVAKRVHREVRFGAYILGSTLGEGEFGKVKLGWRKDGKHPSQVAIKLIKRDSILKDSESEIKIHREINSLKLLNHPNIVNLVEVMKSGKYIGIVLEYASGGELFDYILHHKYLKENVAKKLFAQLISGVDYMHSKGLIHRDLKLENLLLDKHKNVIISDFGFVNSYNREKNDLMKTSCGSPCYAAPELVLTQSPYEGRKVDIWSAGVILYAMLAGYLPFDDDPENEDGSDIVRLYHYICKTPLTFPKYVSPLARDLLRKIIVPDPKKRISMNEIRNHPWLAPHANLLSIRQPEWDRIQKQKDDIMSAPTRQTAKSQMPPQYNQNKRFSMVNERTNSSALMSSATNSVHHTSNIQSAQSHGRSYSSTSISQLYSSPSTSFSMANAVALPKTGSTATPANPVNPASQESSSVSSSPTKSGYVPGHTKSASLSTYPLASNALKAVVIDDNKRNSMTSLESLNLQMPPPSTSPTNKHYTTSNSGFHFPPPTSLPRSTTYTGTPISTIVESPTKRPEQSPMLPPPAPLSTRSTTSSRESSRLPHSTNKPRPTSYHPSSMTSSLLSGGNGSTSALLDYIKIPSPINLPIPQFLSTSPTKASPVSEMSEETVRSQHNSPSHPAPSRKNSVVTHVHVNGVLSNEGESPDNSKKRNSVLSYLEDKMDQLDLTDVQASPIKGSSASPIIGGPEIALTPQINQLPTFDIQTVSPTVQTDEKAHWKDKIASATPSREVTPEFTTSTVKDKHLSMTVEMVQEKSQETVDSLPKKDNRLEEPLSVKPKTKKKSPAPAVESRTERSMKKILKDEDKENKEARETKKRNRFSLLSLYSSYNTPASGNGSTSDVATTSTTSSSPSVSSKKVLEPTDLNVPPASSNSYKEQQKRIHSGSSSNSRKSNQSSTGSSSASGKEASAARKVMDFFKRRSVRIG